jgi:hypothetical protein
MKLQKSNTNIRELRKEKKITDKILYLYTVLTTSRTVVCFYLTSCESKHTKVEEIEIQTTPDLHSS